MRETMGSAFVGGFMKGLRVIEAFGPDRPNLAIADVSRRTGLDRSTCRRLLLTLTSLGYAERDGKLFSLTPRILGLGYAYFCSASLPNILQPSLEKLSRDTRESCSASVLDGDCIIYIARASQRRVMSINLSVGSRLPVYCSSMGRVLLAALPTDAASRILAATELQALTPKTCIDPDALMQELGRVREQGFALVDEELELGLRSLAVPVLDHDGVVVAAINIGTQTASATLEQMTTLFLPQMRRLQIELRHLVI